VSPERLSGGQGGDLGLVVGEGSVSDPDSGSFGAVEPAAVPALATYQGADPALAFGSPFDGSSDPPAVFDGMLGFGWFAFAGDDDVADAVVVQGILHALLAVATVRGDGARVAAGG